MGCIDERIQEPRGGAHRNKQETLNVVKHAIEKYLNEFQNLTRKEIKESRETKFLNIGKQQKGFAIFSTDRKGIIIKNDFLIIIKEKILQNKKISIIVFLILLIFGIFLI